MTGKRDNFLCGNYITHVYNIIVLDTHSTDGGSLDDTPIATECKTKCLLFFSIPVS